jgi:hypothetical protein
MKKAASRIPRRFRVPAKRNQNQLRRLTIESLELRTVMAAAPIITEFLATNSDGLKDSDLESSDWIELYNPTPTAFDLNGWKLTDNAGDLNQWVFPTTVIQPNDFLVVFASGKNRAVSGRELHTNFKLSSTGEFLALVDPSGTIVSEYAPSFPTQATNVSYGRRFTTQTLLTTGSNAKTLVPTSNSLGNSWTSPNFSDASWNTTPVGVGFGVVEPGFDVTYYKSNVEVVDLHAALNVLATPSQQAFQVSSRVPSINYMGNGGGGHYNNDLAFPTQNIGDDFNDFVVRATTSLVIPTAGNWSFGVNSDDGFRLTLSRNGIDYVSEYPWPRGPSDTITTLNLPSAGEYTATLIMYERAGGASLEFFAAPGAVNDWNSGDFDLVGDVNQGGLAGLINVPAGPDSPLRSDISDIMLGVNSSAFVRIPFSVTSPSNFDSLRFRVRYDDGFVAYLNGVEIARRNAPTSLAYNSSATVDLTPSQSLVTEEINLGSFISALVAGNNVLAIQGLNSSASDSSFLILPELIGSQLFETDLKYFSTPTPGSPNSAPSLGIVDRVTSSLAAGFYNSPITVALTTTTTGSTIRYTTDGSLPSETNGAVYTAPIAFSGTTNLRAIAYQSGYVSLPSITRSYVFLDDVLNQSSNGAPPVGWPSTWGGNVVDYGIDPDVVALEGAATIKNALTSISTLSITTDLANLFDPATGIYSNAYQDGRDWERAASVELINPNSTAGFQVNAGLRIRGGYSRSNDNPKHSFRLFFRGVYGDSSLDYPIFGNEGASSFKKLDLRTAQNYSWSFGGDPSNNFVTDVFNRYSQRDAGLPYSRSEWYHLYLNGQYWGLYQTQERTEAEYAASYLGGLPLNYDVIKPEAGAYAIYATDGNLDAWGRLWNAVNQNQSSNLPTVSSNSEYLKLQGKNPDGSDNPSYEVLLDVDNLANYMIGILYGGNLDAPISAFLNNERVNNFFAIRDRTGRQGFKYFMHDSEHTLRNVNENRNGPWPAGSDFNYSNPQWLHQRLMTNAEYRIRFADIVEKNFYYNGALSVSSSQARFNAEAAKINQAIYAESARWGDAKRPDSPLLHSDWVNAVNGVVGGFFPLRVPTVIDQFRNTTWNGFTAAPLFPSIDAPTFIVNGNLLHGGQIAPNSNLRFGAASGTVYYTTDGSDPRLFGGAINPGALVYLPSSSSQTIISANSSWKYRDTGVDLGSSWQANGFDDTAWSSGNAELGYGDGDESTVVAFGPNANNKYITTYFRKSFTIADVGSVTALSLRLKRDDGAVVFINGVEAARSNMPTGSITASTLAATSVGGLDESTFFDFTLNPGLLVNGNNSIAIEIHQSSANSSDISFDAQLDVTVQNTSAIALGVTPQFFRARTQTSSGIWSAIEEASFSVPLVAASAPNLAVTEIQYNPIAYSGPNATSAPFNDKENFEFIELRNKSGDVISLDGVSLTGVTYTFPSSASGPVTWLLPGESIVIVKNQQAFAARYLTPGSPFIGIKIAPGDYGSTNLSNGGEAISVIAANTDVIQSFVYDDTGLGWPTSTDGGGPSLTVIRTNTALYNNGDNWRASYFTNGTPGREENDAPLGLAISGTSVAENAAGGLVGILTTDDPDDRDTFTYSIQAGLDGGLFAILGSELRVGTLGLNFEASNNRKVIVKTTDALGASLVKTITISVLDANDPPVPSTGGPYNIGEGQVLTLNGSATDEDAGQSLIYEWDLDYDGLVFTADLLGSAPSISFPDNLARTIAMRATDNGTPAKNAIQTTTISVSNLPPTLTRLAANVSGNVLSTITNSGTWNDVPADTVSLTASLGSVVKNANGTWAWSFVPSVAYSNQTVTINAQDEDGGTSSVSFLLAAIPVVSNTQIYYKGSFFAASSVSSALDTNKVVVQSGTAPQQLSFANLINSSRGINGLVLDVAGLAATNLTAADFGFRMSPIGNFTEATNPPSGWALAPTPTISVVAGNATTPARIKLEWPDNAIENRWLQIRVLPNARTGLLSQKTFYVGHLMGETDGLISSRGLFQIGNSDITQVKASIGDNANASSIVDLDKDGRVRNADITYVKNGIGVRQLRVITIPAEGSGNEGSGSSGIVPPSILPPTLPPITLPPPIVAPPIEAPQSSPPAVAKVIPSNLFAVPERNSVPTALMDAKSSIVLAKISSSSKLLSSSSNDQTIRLVDDYFASLQVESLRPTFRG